MIYDCLFQAASSLTFGLVTDLQTAMVAMVCISFILIGFERLKEILDTAAMQNGGIPGVIARKYQDFRISRLKEKEFTRRDVSRNDIEISPLRKRDLDIAIGDHDTEGDLYQQLKASRRKSSDD